jgi:hypothetical protein
MVCRRLGAELGAVRRERDGWGGTHKDVVLGRKAFRTGQDVPGLARKSRKTEEILSKPVPSATRPPAQSLRRALKLTAGMRLRTPAFARTYIVTTSSPPHKPESLERDMLIRMIGAVLVLATGSVEANRPVAATNPPIDQLSWLAGCLEMRSGDRLVEENRMAPRQGSMLGMGRTTTSKGLIEFELTLIREKEGRIVFEAMPSGQPKAVFTAVAAGRDSVVFAAPEHDYPQIVGYRRQGADSVIAWIDGKAEGTRRRVEFPYRRLPCPGSVAR